MKVERKQKEFVPITITIETREEAICLWYRLYLTSYDVNRSTKQTFDAKIYAIDCRNIISMWEKFNHVFDPRRENEG